MISREKLISDVKHLPTLPVSLARISALSRDETSDMSDIEQALRPDPALTANILRLANSAYYGLSRQVTSVHHALMFMGTKKVLELAMGSAFSQLVPRVLPGYGIDAATFWKHSVAVAVLSEQMSIVLEVGPSEEAFTCGLLHDLGKLVTSTYLSQKTGAIMQTLQQGDCSFVQAEHHLLGLDHTEVGLAIAKSWQLPETFCEVVRWHHAPQPGGAAMVDIVHIANCLAHAMGYGADIGELSREIDSAALARLNAPIRTLERIVSDSVAHIDGLSELVNDTRGGS